MPSPAFLTPAPALRPHATAPLRHITRAPSRPRFACTLAPVAQRQRLLTWFRGDFDNYFQVANDRALGVRPHEHMHVRLQPLDHADLAPPDHCVMYATYYYNGKPDVIYRRRLYSFVEKDDAIEMRLYKMTFLHGLRVAAGHANLGKMEMGSLDDRSLYEHLDGSQIVWRYFDGPHDGSEFVENGAHFVGTMRDGGFTGQDSMRYEDELVLTKEDLWVAEKVFNPEGVMIGGNREGIPHKMRRVRRNDEIKWTLDFELPDFTAPEIS